MIKLIEAFRANPTKENAIKVARHAIRHPMSLLFLDNGQIDAYDKAMTMAGFPAK